MEYSDCFCLLDRADLAQVQEYLALHPKAINALDEKGVPAVMHAMAAGSFSLCQWLLEATITKISIKDAEGNGILHYAAKKGDRRMLQYLVERIGFDPLEGNKKGETPYEVAHVSGNREGEDYFQTVVGAAWGQLYKNPVLPGFHPDPSIVRVGEDYYMVNSSFTWFPGVPVSHSRDLIHWELIGHVFTDENTAQLCGLASGHGYWAPDISYSNGRFYVTVTLRRADDDLHPRVQAVTSAANPAGPYDEPSFIEIDGIDPSLFTDDDGKRYMVVNRGGRLVPLSEDAKAAAGPARMIWGGVNHQASEGPHLLKKDGWYYMVLAEGGTGWTHQISVGRSRTIDGIYQPCPYNPVLHQYKEDGYIQKSGHGKLVQTQNGDWYMVYLCSRPIDRFSPLGRETAIDPVTWTEDGWPIVNSLKGPSVLQIKPPLPTFVPQAASMNPAAKNTRWVCQREATDASLDDAALTLHGHPEDLCDIHSKSGLFTRQTALHCIWSAFVSKPKKSGRQVGICGYYDEYSYCKFGMQKDTNATSLSVTLRDGHTEKIAADKPIPDVTEGLWLSMEADGLSRRFSVSRDGHTWQLFAELKRVEALADEGVGFGKRFTGSMLGLYAIGNDFTATFTDIKRKNM
jgi:xylan 1,4-beta-xylosidase